jgi:hypothetical protein
MPVNDEGRRIATGFRCDFSGYGLNMAAKKNPREWGSIRKQPTKSARFRASYVGSDLLRTSH